VIRKGARANIKIIASVSLEGQEALAATLNDLSTGGASGVIKKPLGIKGQAGVIKFKVNAAGNDEYLSLAMVLRSINPVEQGEGYRHGFEFQDITPQAKLILSAFVHQTIAEED
jgi:c-di-GMP-binding flagellar brake protein YcgR